MSRELFRDLAAQLFPTASLVDLRGWGESTILPHFEEYVTHAADYGAPLRLVTNGLSLSQTAGRALLEADATIVVSVDCSTQESSNVLQRGSQRHLRNHLTRLAELKREVGLGRIFFNTVVSSVSIAELNGILSLGNDCGIERMTLFPIIVDLDNPLHLTHVDRGRIISAIDSLRVAAQELAIPLRLGASLTNDLVLEHAQMSRCTHPWSVAYIDYRGGMGYCDHLIGQDSQILGRLQAGDEIDAVWNGAGFRDLRRRHALRSRQPCSDELHRHCNWCYVRRYVDFEDALFPADSSRVVSSLSADPMQPALPHQALLNYEFHDHLGDTLLGPVTRTTGDT